MNRQTVRNIAKQCKKDDEIYLIHSLADKRITYLYAERGQQDQKQYRALVKVHLNTDQTLIPLEQNKSKRRTKTNRPCYFHLLNISHSPTGLKISQKREEKKSCKNRGIFSY